MKKNKTLLITSFLCLVPLIFSAIVYSKLPEQLVVHWSSDNTPDGYLPKLIGAFGLPIFMAVLNLIIHISLDNDPRRCTSAPALPLLGKWAVPVLTLILMPVTLLWNLDHKLSIDKIVMLLVGIVFIVTGNYLPKSKQNYTIGIKLPWTLHSEENWNRTHHLAGYLWIVGGIVMIFGMFFPMPLLSLAIIFVLVLVPAVYSFLLYKKGI